MKIKIEILLPAFYAIRVIRLFVYAECYWKRRRCSIRNQYVLLSGALVDEKATWAEVCFEIGFPYFILSSSIS